jgi:hypothetical protein
MKRYISSTLIIALSACASSVLQSNIFAHSNPDMEKVDSECANTAANEKNMHVAAVSCRFDAYEVILGERGFQEYNDLDTLKTQFVSIAKQQDAHKITDEKALALFEKYTQEFYANLQRHDNIKARAYAIQQQQTMAVIGAVASGLGAGMQTMGNAYQARADAYGNAADYQQQSIIQQQQWQQQQQAEQQQRQQQQDMQAQQQKMQAQQNEINRLNGRSPAEILRDCAQAGNCAGAFAAPYPQDSYGSYGSVPAAR